MSTPAAASVSIRQRQDEPKHLQRLLAYSYLYRTAQHWHRCRTAGTFALATIAPVVAILVPASSRFAGTTTTVPMLAEPDSTQRDAFDLIGVPIPLTLKS